MSDRLYDLLPSPVGELLALADGRGLCGLHLQEGPSGRGLDPSWRRRPAAFTGLRRQLGEYFAGERSRFDLELSLGGSAWQARVWHALREIPYGETRSYGELAERLGRPRAARAVGSANGANPIAIVIGCHRLIGSDGSLTGYAGGVDRKRALLELEQGSVSGRRARTGGPP